MSTAIQHPASDSVQAFEFKSIKDLFDMPQESVPWLVEGLLPAFGMSALVGKPKKGKSTLARQLCVAVAQGKKFLERDTTQSSVFYVALEEKPTEVISHLRLLGATSTDQIRILCGAVSRRDAVARLSAALSDCQPDVKQLVIIDPLFKFLNVRD